MRTKLIVEFAKLDPEAMMPTQGSPQAAGWDLYALDEIVIKRNISSLIRTGLAVAIPEGWEGQLRCRSSLGKKGMIMPSLENVRPGIKPRFLSQNIAQNEPEKNIQLLQTLQVFEQMNPSSSITT